MNLDEFKTLVRLLPDDLLDEYYKVAIEERYARTAKKKQVFTNSAWTQGGQSAQFHPAQWSKAIGDQYKGNLLLSALTRGGQQNAKNR